MDEILTDLSAPALLRAIKANLYAFFRYLGRSAQTEMYTRPGFTRWHTVTRHPWFNGVLSGRPAGDDSAKLIQDVLEYFQSRDVPAITWWLEPDLPPETWNRHLLPYGFRYDASTPGMAVDLQALREEEAGPTGLRVSPVADLDVLSLWTRVFVEGYGLPREWADHLFMLLADLGLDLPIRNYLGFIDGRPAATSSAFLAAGVAGVQFVATLPEARGQGVGTAMTVAALREARALGYRAGVLQSSESGFRVYQRLGFQDLCRMEHFYWTARPSAT